MNGSKTQKPAKESRSNPEKKFIPDIEKPAKNKDLGSAFSAVGRLTKETETKMSARAEASGKARYAPTAQRRSEA